MSGGSLNYVYSAVSDAASQIAADERPEYAAFGQHLKLVAKALHEVEWEYSCDTGKGDALKAIAEAMHSNLNVLSLYEVLKDIRVAVSDLDRISKREYDKVL